MFEIRRYTAGQADEWNAFVAASKNGTFLFDRRYMDYHSDRFEDCSLMVYYKSELYALLPANRLDDTLYSHQGLTYGGLLLSSEGKTAVVRDAFVAVNAFLRQEGIRRVRYKHIPWIYASLPSEEDLFALHNVCQAQICSRDVSTVVMLSHRLPLSELRGRCVKKARQAGVEIREVQDCGAFWPLLEENLKARYNARPVHSLEEIVLLKSRFPQQIRLFVACREGRVIGGTLLYICARTVKTQYISANEEGRRVGALDLLFTTLMDQCTDNGMEYFDFGTSNRPDNNDLNDSLIFQKEGFGGRAVCYDTYEYSL